MKRLNIVTLGVKDLEKSKVFFQKLFNWKPKDKDSSDIAFYDMGGWMLALYPLKLLAEDITLPSSVIDSAQSGFSGFTLAHNVSKKQEDAQVLEKAKDCGAKIIKPAQDVFWGGHSGYFQDLDGHYWEVAWNPFTPVLPDGTLDIKSDNNGDKDN